eukprot:4777045-Prymnesium_polylepis.2
MTVRRAMPPARDPLRKTAAPPSEESLSVPATWNPLMRRSCSTSDALAVKARPAAAPGAGVMSVLPSAAPRTPA